MTPSCLAMSCTRPGRGSDITAIVLTSPNGMSSSSAARMAASIFAWIIGSVIFSLLMGTMSWGYSAPQRSATSVTSREPATKRLRSLAATASWAAVSAAKRSRMILSAARWANTSPSSKLLDARRLRPCTPLQQVSPAAKRCGSVVSESEFTWMPPMK